MTEEITYQITEPKNVEEAILFVYERFGYVQKQRTQGLNYSYAGEAAFINGLRPVMIEAGLTVRIIKVEEFNQLEYETKNGTPMINTTALYTARFVHAKSGTYVDVQARGEGSDSGDKGTNKCATGALKYILRQTFMVETGDDPDATSSDTMERKGGTARTTTTRTANKPVATAQAATRVDLNDPKSIALNAPKKGSGALIDFALAKGLYSSRDEAKANLAKVLADLPLPPQEAEWGKYIETIDTYRKPA